MLNNILQVLWLVFSPIFKKRKLLINAREFAQPNCVHRRRADEIAGVYRQFGWYSRHVLTDAFSIRGASQIISHSSSISVSFLWSDAYSVIAYVVCVSQFKTVKSVDSRKNQYVARITVCRDGTTGFLFCHFKRKWKFSFFRELQWNNCI